MSDEDDRTIIQPGVAPGSPEPPAPPPAHSVPPTPSPALGAPAPEPNEATIIAPAAGSAAENNPFPSRPVTHDATVIAPAGPHSSAPPPLPPTSPASGSTRTRSGIDVGDVLNGIYEVTRFIARGGMGEVFEGKNTNGDERVAIKVILPSLAQDPAVLEMFRKEAAVLTRLSHPALVQYRVQTREPTLGVFYIVTDYIEGTSAEAVLGKITPTAEELIGLTRRLAEGLRAAHEFGAIHRDISPDNILLESGRLDRARIIDFGIAKDADPGSKTVIGTGFAGKLTYVAPEQLGDFGRNVGPWTDVYSLALVILALAQGKAADIGGSFVDAIEKRRAGVDVSAVPEPLRPLIAHMLRPDPLQRPQSMDAVLEELAQLGKTTKARGASSTPKPSSAGKSTNDKADGRKPLPKAALIGGSAAAGLALLGALGWIAFGGGEERAAEAPTTAPTIAAASTTGVQTAATAASRSVPCSWLDLATTGSPGGVTLTGSGVAGNPTEAETAIFRAASSGGTVSASDFSRVAAIDRSFCPTLDNLRVIRAENEGHLSVSQPRYELATFQDGMYKGQKGARVILDLSLAGVANFSLYSIERAGEINQIFDRATFDQLIASNNKSIEKLPGRDHYRLSIDGTMQPSWAGMLLLTGNGGFQPTLPEVTGDPEKFRRQAAANNWQAEMVWYKFVDDTPD